MWSFFEQFIVFLLQNVCTTKTENTQKYPFLSMTKWKPQILFNNLSVFKSIASNNHQINVEEK